jgi:flavodoxin
VPGTPEEINDTEENESIILVFSPTGNTKRMAGYISELADIELTEILPAIPYTEEDLNRRNEESRTFKEYKDNSIRPEIETEINIDDYDTIYL